MEIVDESPPRFCASKAANGSHVGRRRKRRRGRRERGRGRRSTSATCPRFSELADTYKLLKLGGSDYHGRGGHDESDLGSVDLPLISVYEFLKMARPVWCNAVKDVVLSYADEPSAANLEKITRFGKLKNLKGYSTPSCGKDVVQQCLSSWLTNDEKEGDEFEAIRMKLAHIDISNEGLQNPQGRRRGQGLGSGPCQPGMGFRHLHWRRLQQRRRKPWDSGARGERRVRSVGGRGERVDNEGEGGDGVAGGGGEEEEKDEEAEGVLFEAGADSRGNGRLRLL